MCMCVQVPTEATGVVALGVAVRHLMGTLGINLSSSGKAYTLCTSLKPPYCLLSSLFSRSCGSVVEFLHSMAGPALEYPQHYKEKYPTLFGSEHEDLQL